jgi:hypothetical protein
MEKEVTRQECRVYTLKYPVTLGELACTEVKLGRPKFKDFMAVGREPIDTAGGVVSLIASVSGLPEGVVRLFDVDDAAVMRIEAARMIFAYFEGSGYRADPTMPPEAAAGNG